MKPYYQCFVKEIFLVISVLLIVVNVPYVILKCKTIYRGVAKSNGLGGRAGSNCDLFCHKYKRGIKESNVSSSC